MIRTAGATAFAAAWVSSGYAERRDPSYCPTCKGPCRDEGPMDEEE